MIILALPNKAKKIKSLLSNDAKWCYLGKDIAKREKIAKVLGEERRCYLKDRLQRKAETLMQPYMDFVARIGKEQKDQLNWWASRFASKRQMQTDFFLLVCYKALAIELLQQKISSDRLVIFIEDPWLFMDIKAMYDDEDIRFVGSTNLFFVKLFLAFRGLIHRLFLVVWVVAARLFVYYHHKGERPKVLETEKSAVVIINPAEKRTFKNGRYVNNFTTGLPALYEKNKIPFFYLYPLYFPLSTAKYVGMNKEKLWPLILDVNFFNVVKKIFEYWKPALDSNVLNNIGGYNTSVLLQRERWMEFSSAGFNVHLSLFDALDCFFSRHWCCSIIYVFENQPWEKMLCMAALKNNIKIAGYQHSSISRLYLSQFIGKKENLFVPLPYKIITSGSNFAELYKNGGMPEDKIVIGGAWRYWRTMDEAKDGSFAKKGFNPKLVILIPLCIDIFISKSILESVFKAISKNYLGEKMEFCVKPHPGYTKHELSKLNKVLSRYRIVDRPFDALLKDADIVISSISTTSGLEAFLCGKKVIFYMPENFVAADPLLDITHERIYRWYEGEDVNMDFLKDFSQTSNSEDINMIKNRYFGKINHETWLKVAYE